MAFRKICVIHLNQIGDLVFSLPLLKALKENSPTPTVHSVIRPHLKDLLIRSPYVDHVLYREKGIKNKLGFLREIRRNRYDLLITLSRAEESLLLAAFSRARVKAGFKNPPWDLGLHVKEAMEGPPSLYNNLRLLKRLNIEVKKKDYVNLLPLPSESHRSDGREKYVVISAGTSSRRRIKEWEEEKFGDLILQLRERFDLQPVLVGGEESKGVNEKIIQRVKEKEGDRSVGPIENLTGKTSLIDLCHLLKRASLFVGVDSGVMHLASAFDIPVVGIFGPTDPSYIGPQNSRSRVVRAEEMECVPCDLKGCEERACLKHLEVQRVFDACEEVLRK